MSKEKEVGNVFAYYNKIGVAAVKLSASLKVGDAIHIKGATTDFQQDVEVMQVDKSNIEKAKSGEEIGLKVDERVRPKDIIYKVNP